MGTCKQTNVPYIDLVGSSGSGDLEAHLQEVKCNPQKFNRNQTGTLGCNPWAHGTVLQCFAELSPFFDFLDAKREGLNYKSIF